MQLEGATALAGYDHPHFGRFPAIVSQPFGKGRVTYCGTLPNPALGKALAAWAMQQAGIEAPFAALPEAVRVNSARAASGERLYFFTNWSWETQTLTGLPVSGRQLLRGGAADGALTLGAWETEIVVG